MDMPFAKAVAVSVIIHAAIFAPLYRAAIVEEPVKKMNEMVVEYVVSKDKPRTPPPETPRLELAKNISMTAVDKPAATPVKEEERNKEAHEDPAKKQAEIRSTKDYINYYQLIREKIRRKLKTNYTDKSKEGMVTLAFTLSSDGALKKAEVVKAASVDDLFLQKIAVSSVEEASPFKAFPKALSQPEMQFNLTVEFKREY